MKILKSILLSEDNIQEIWNCPAVCRLTKVQLDASEPVCSTDWESKPVYSVTFNGWGRVALLKERAEADYLILDEKGFWSWLRRADYEYLIQNEN